MAPNTVRAWGDRGRIPEYRHPANNYRLYKRSELEELIRQIEESDTYSSIWLRSATPR